MTDLYNCSIEYTTKGFEDNCNQKCSFKWRIHDVKRELQCIAHLEDSRNKQLGVGIPITSIHSPNRNIFESFPLKNIKYTNANHTSLMSKRKGRVHHDKHLSYKNQGKKIIRNLDLAANEPVDILYFNTGKFMFTIWCNNNFEYRLLLTVLRLIPATSDSHQVLSDTLMRGTQIV